MHARNLQNIYIYIYTHNKYIWQSMTYCWMDKIEILKSVDSLTFSINIGDILKMKRY